MSRFPVLAAALGHYHSPRAAKLRTARLLMMVGAVGP